ncbi:MAG: hypothetical protein ACHQ1G_04955 [Planctomycetota bacterium]
MRTILLAALLAMPALAEEKIDLAVLYAGVKDDPRTAEFTEFLSKTFARVTAIDLGALNAATADAADVVIVDSPSPYKEGGKFEFPKAPELGTDYAKPTILMGAAGGVVLNTNRTLKLNWL